MLISKEGGGTIELPVSIYTSFRFLPHGQSIISTCIHRLAMLARANTGYMVPSRHLSLIHVKPRSTVSTTTRGNNRGAESSTDTIKRDFAGVPTAAPTNSNCGRGRAAASLGEDDSAEPISGRRRQQTIVNHQRCTLLSTIHYWGSRRGRAGRRGRGWCWVGLVKSVAVRPRLLVASTRIPPVASVALVAPVASVA